MVSQFFVTLCGQLAPITAFVVFLSPLPTVNEMRKNQSVGILPLLPYSTMVVNCFLWTLYGILRAEPIIWTSNSTGCILGLYYFTTFCKICPSDASNLPGTKLHHKIMMLTISILAVLSPFTLQRNTAEDIIGRVGVFFCIILFGSPLSKMKEVIQMQSAESIPLPFTFACVSNCFLWVVYGWFETDDFNVYFPNFLGFLLGLIQVVLKVLYRDKVKRRLDGEMSKMIM